VGVCSWTSTVVMDLPPFKWGVTYTQNKGWDICFVCGAPIVQDWPTTWEAIQLHLNNFKLLTLLIGEFNQIEHHLDKLGGSEYIRGWDEFIKWNIEMGLIDLLFTKSQFTWCSKQFHEDLIFERLDRAYCTTDWKNMFDDSYVFNFPIIV